MKDQWSGRTTFLLCVLLALVGLVVAATVIGNTPPPTVPPFEVQLQTTNPNAPNFDFSDLKLVKAAPAVAPVQSYQPYIPYYAPSSLRPVPSKEDQILAEMKRANDIAEGAEIQRHLDADAAASVIEDASSQQHMDAEHQQLQMQMNLLMQPERAPLYSQPVYSTPAFQQWRYDPVTMTWRYSAY